MPKTLWMRRGVAKQIRIESWHWFVDIESLSGYFEHRCFVRERRDLSSIGEVSDGAISNWLYALAELPDYLLPTSLASKSSSKVGISPCRSSSINTLPTFVVCDSESLTTVTASSENSWLEY